MLNGNDLELLSAYLDGALTDQERADLEARLLIDADLRRELARLRATVDLVKALPPLTAPRNFTLTRQTARRSSFITSATFSALSTAAAVILLMVGVVLFSRSSLNSPAANMVLMTEARDEQSEIVVTQAMLALVPTQTALVGEQTGAAAVTENSVPVETDGGLIAPPVGNAPVEPSTQKLNTQEAQGAQGVDSFMPYATGTLPPQATGEPLADALRFAAEPTTEAPSDTNTQSRVDDETETLTEPSQEAADLADASAALTQQENAAAPPAPASAVGGAAAEAPLPQATMLSTTKPSNTPTDMPSPAPTSTLPPTQTTSPAATTTPMPTTTPIPPAQPAQADQRTPESSDTVGIALIVAGLILFAVAVVTTIMRRRG